MRCESKLEIHQFALCAVNVVKGCNESSSEGFGCCGGGDGSVGDR